MTWIESHVDLKDHPKRRRLTIALHVSAVQTVGHLHFLWWFALEYADDGDLSAFTDQEIADAAGWRGTPSKFIDALQSSGFVDDDRHLHDWDAYAGKLIGRRKANAARKRELRAAQAQNSGSPVDVRGTAQDVPRTQTSVRRTSVATGPDRTGPDRTGTTPPAPPARGGESGGIGKKSRRATADELRTAEAKAFIAAHV